MRVVDTITSPGSAGRLNEDRVGYAGSMAWVIDGATDLYPDTALPAASDVQWLVETIDERLRDAAADGYRGSGAALLHQVADHIAARMAALGFPDDRVPPACSLVLAIDDHDSDSDSDRDGKGGQYEITRVGDATAATTGATPALLATDFFDRREAHAVQAERDGQPPETVLAGKHLRRIETMTAGATESIFSGHPRRRLLTRTISGSWADTDTILLCTDGFARLITDHHLYPSWDALIPDARERGLAYLEKLLRDIEADPAAAGAGRFKTADDIAAALIGAA